MCHSEIKGLGLLDIWTDATCTSHLWLNTFCCTFCLLFHFMLYLWLNIFRPISLSRNSSDTIQSRKYICYMMYRYSVLYFLNLSLNHFISHRKRQFLWKYTHPEAVIVPCFNAFAHAQSTYFPIEERRHCTLQVHQFAKLNDICPSDSGAKLLKIAQKWKWHWTGQNFMCKHRQSTFGPTGALPVLCALYCMNLLN